MSKSAIIPGGGSGIGKAIARALHADGYAVALIGRRIEPIETVAGELDPSGKTVLPLQADIGTPALALR